MGTSELGNSAKPSPGGGAASPTTLTVDPPGAARQLGFGELATLRPTLELGGVDDSNRSLELPPSLRANLGPLTNSLRWGAVGFGLVYAVPQAVSGDLAVVVALSLTMFLTTWRTVIPLRLGNPSVGARVPAITDSMVFGLAVGISGGAGSNFVIALIAAILIASLGWGPTIGIASACVGWATVVVGMVATSDALTPMSSDELVPVAFMVGGFVLVVVVRNRLLETEARRQGLSRRVEVLNDTNDLLSALNSIARSLPSSLNLRDAVDSLRRQLQESFDPQVLALLDRDADGDWTPRLAEGIGFSPNQGTSALPAPLTKALDSPTPVLSTPLARGVGMRPGSTSGMYARLVARGQVVGLLGLETDRAGGYGPKDAQLLLGLADVAGLTLDNARRFGHLRTLGAQNERIRIARDLHDRLGQWLTYFKLELERISNNTDDDPELDRLSSEADQALDDLRETLRQLRSAVSEDRTFSMEVRDLIGRLERRSDLRIRFTETNPGETLTAPVETEILRIVQEALNNVEKHAKATNVSVTWTVADGSGCLTVTDDGRGFETRGSVRENSYGLVGMRERADAIGAQLAISSRPGAGTTIAVNTVTDRQGATT
ncbi:MAG: GAF domain-containing sensor histidine kinase [Microthrixaceae bacterium]